MEEEKHVRRRTDGNFNVRIIMLDIQERGMGFSRGHDITNRGETPLF